MCLGKTAAFELVGDDGEKARPVRGRSPELDNGEEDVLVAVQGALFDYNAGVEGDG